MGHDGMYLQFIPIQQTTISKNEIMSCYTPTDEVKIHMRAVPWTTPKWNFLFSTRLYLEKTILRKELIN